MKKIFSLIVGLACCGSVAAQQTYTLEQLKQLAVENNYSLHSAQNSIQQSKQQRKEAFTKYFPTVSALGMGMTLNKYLIEADLNLPMELQMMLPAGVELPSDIHLIKNGVFGAVSAIQPVFMGGMIVNGNKLAKVGQQASEIKMELSEDQVELTTEQYYWKAVTLKEKQKTLNSIHDMLVELEKDVTNMVRVGAVNRNDLLQVQLRKGEIESSQAEIESGLSTICQLLAQHVGKKDETIDVTLPADLSALANAEVPNLPLTLRQDHLSALAATPEYRLLEKNVESQRLLHQMKIGENLPKVGVGASYTYNNVMDGNRGIGILFVGVNVPQMSDSGQKLIIKMNNAWSAVETSHKKLLIAHDAIGQADENLRLNKDYYRVGTTKMSDLLLAQQQYQSACDRYTDAYADFQTKQLEYRQATGQE